MAKKKWVLPGGEAERARLLAEQAASLAEYAAKALVAAGQLRIKTEPVGELSLRGEDRDALCGLPTLPAKVRKKLAKAAADLTVADVAEATMAVAEAFPGAGSNQQTVLLRLAGTLMACLQQALVAPDRRAVTPKSKATGLVYTIKITLAGTKPPVWRRIVVEDCTLGELHAHIQAAMGWTNSHLHHFRLGERLYGDPDLMADSFGEFDYENSTAVRLSDLVPKSGKKPKLIYEYDFGDSWDHQLVVESVGPPEAGAKYPACVDGKRSCPPEDVGGVWGYADFLDAIRDPDHEQHEDMLEWVGGRFDADEFDPAAATRRMRRGRPDRRRVV
jgi:hypothetical protein